MNKSSIDTTLAATYYQEMLRIRLVETEIAERYSEQEMRCPVHLSDGQESVAVGVCSALKKTDKIFSNHRCHAHYLAKGGDMGRMLAEIYGKETGCLGGRGGSMHLADPDCGLMASIPIVSSAIPLAAGSALADQQNGLNHVTLVFFGDASVEEGVFHETANFASLRNLPVVFVCENNVYSMYTNIRDRQPNRSILDLPAAHAIQGYHEDGNDIFAVHKATKNAVERARSGAGPTFLLFDTYRWREHCGPALDPEDSYRDKGEYDTWLGNCPIERIKRVMNENGNFPLEWYENVEKNIRAEITESFNFAKTSPLPSPLSENSETYA